jgi:cytochrome bd-type quinol oxidase subunit 1
VLVSLVLFIAFYLTLLGVFARYVVRAVREGPGDGPIVDPVAPSRQPAPLPNPAPAS